MNEFYSMTKYEALEAKRNYCLVMAKYYESESDKKLTDFYYNAAEGFKIKQQKLTVAEAGY